MSEPQRYTNSYNFYSTRFSDILTNVNTYESKIFFEHESSALGTLSKREQWRLDN